MTRFFELRFVFCAAFLALAGVPVQADDLQFDLRGFGRSIGAMTVTTGPDAAVDAVTDGMPLDAFNGTFKAKVTDGSARSYVADRVSANGNRRLIEIGFAGARVHRASVQPQADQTEYSQATSVDEPVVSPVDVLTAAMSATSCGKTFTFYDGRRIVDLAMNGAVRAGEGYVCSGQYHIRKGPGHGSFLNIRNLPITLHFPSADAPAARIETRLMGFGLAAVRS